ncbi:enoyl-CoA hydratase/isomerase family protein [Nocardioides sp. R-C-SC26]|uniref:enoyl-CoA hydratase/isomerase family protein n=1 Tax=Nocardioides sp. R-C-SC26 TaxID=2870414 RepID=UPI001E34239B|nr:enoyl-CoA hydratase/isomerase family protein [Nocardioides sp. R-C-SC26]
MTTSEIPAASPLTTEELDAAGLRLEVAGPVATVTLDRPDSRNSQTPLMWRTLARIGASLADDVRVVVVTGEGPSFSAGLDRRVLDPTASAGQESVADLMTLSDDEASAAIDAYQQGFTWLRDPRFVSIAAVRGYAVGAGFQLALSCDLILAADDARFCMKESALGLVPDLTGTKPLVERVGYSRALEICVSARMVPAAEAAALGIATRAVPGDQLDDALAELVATMTAPLPGAVSETKRVLQGAIAHDLDTQRRIEREAQVRRFRELVALLAGS